MPPSFPSAVQCEKLLGGYRRHKHRDRNAGSKISREGKDTGRKPKANYQQPRKPLETQGPWPDLKGFCIKALTYILYIPSDGLVRTFDRGPLGFSAGRLEFHPGPCHPYFGGFDF